jgi:hypothetical protein
VKAVSVFADPGVGCDALMSSLPVRITVLSAERAFSSFFIFQINEKLNKMTKSVYFNRAEESEPIKTFLSRN